MRRTTHRAPMPHSTECESVPDSRYRLETSCGHCSFESSSASHARYLVAQLRGEPCSSPSGPCIREKQFVDFPATAPTTPRGVSQREREPPATRHPKEYFAVRTAQIS